MLRGIAVLGISIALAACSGGGATTNPTAAAGTAAGTAAAGGEAPCTDSTGTATVSATVADNTWTPSTVNAKVGDVITWTNGDGVPHGVALDDGSCKMSKSIAPSGGTGSLTFSKAGTYPFHCFVHPSMKGTIVIS